MNAALLIWTNSLRFYIKTFVTKNCFNIFFSPMGVKYLHIFPKVVEYPKITQILAGYSATIELNLLMILLKKYI